MHGARKIARDQRRREHRAGKLERHPAIHRRERAGADLIARYRGAAIYVARAARAASPDTLAASISSASTLPSMLIGLLSKPTAMAPRTALLPTVAAISVKERLEPSIAKRRGRLDRNGDAGLPGHSLMQRPQIAGRRLQFQLGPRDRVAAQAQRALHRGV